nr:nucleotidyltransferase family protein [Dyella sp. ASV24]
MPDHRATPCAKPSLEHIKAGLQRTTETLAIEFAHPTGDTPDWNALEWRLATAAAVVHGVAGQLHTYVRWQNSEWTRFLESQYEHVARRHERIDTLLDRIDALARDAGVPLVALKGAALHAMGLYAAGERPMADIDLLVSEDHQERAGVMLEGMGYVLSFIGWKHRVYKPADHANVACLGEHCDTPVNIELHTRIQERLPIAVVDITSCIYPRSPVPGINPYPSRGALMSHLLLHAAGNICNRTMRLIHLNDISLLAARMVRSEWLALWGDGTTESPWWALPPLLLVSRYYTGAVPPSLLYELETECRGPLRFASRHLTLTKASCSELWLHAWSGIEWSRSIREAGQFVMNRLRPSAQARQEREDMVRTQLWLQASPWVTAARWRRALAWLRHPVTRTDTMYVVRAALEQTSPTWAQRPGPAVTT